MKSLLCSLFAIVSLASLAPLHAKTTPAWIHEASDLQPDPAVTYGVLANGLRYAILPHDEPPNRVSLRLFVDAGSLMESDSQQGLAHFLEHMAFNGTTNYPAGEMVEYFQRLGMAFGSHTNAHTSFKETVYKLELPDSQPAMIDEGFKLLRDYADGMLLGEEEIEKERGVILSEKRSRDSPSWRGFVDWIEFAVPGSLVGDRLPIGTEEVIRTAPRSEFVDFYETWYTPERMVVVAVGAVDPATIQSLLETHFGSLPASVPPRPDPDFGTAENRGVVAHHYSDREASETSVSIETKRTTTLGLDSQERRARELSIRIANAMLSRRLDILSKEENSPLISASAHHRDLFDLNLMEYASIDATSRPDAWQEALNVIEQELRRALLHGFTEAELAEARANFLEQVETQAKGAATRKSSDLADSLVERIGSARVFTHPANDLERIKPVLAALTPEAAHLAQREVWSDDQEIAVYASGNLTIEGGPATVLAAFEASRIVAVEPPAEAETAEFAYDTLGEPGEVLSETTVHDLELRQIRFANGVRANFKPTDFEDETVHVLIRFGGGKLDEPKDLPGLALLAAATFQAGGLEAHSADELQRILAGRTVGVRFSVDDDAFVLGGKTNPDDLVLQLQILRAFLQHPGYREEAERQFDKGLDQIYNQLRHTPDGVMYNEVERLIHGGDLRFGYPDQETLAARDLQELQSWLAPVLAEGYLEISLVGDFDLAAATDAVARTFGSLPPRTAVKPAYREARRVSFPENRDAREFRFESEIPKAISLVYWPSSDMSDIEQSRRLGMLASVFRDRLRVKVREELGDAYSPYARNSSSEAFEDYGYLFALVEAAPAQAQPLIEVISEIGQALAGEGITEDELDRSKKPLLTMIEEYRRTNGYWLDSVVSRSQEEPQRLDWARSFISDYESITVAEIDQLAADYLAPEKALEVSIIPE